jgi:F-type H+-transporting ATPase subunit gamma
MPALIDIRRRIRSVKNTQQITRAMKSFSAAEAFLYRRARIHSAPGDSMTRWPERGRK